MAKSLHSDSMVHCILKVNFLLSEHSKIIYIFPSIKLKEQQSSRGSILMPLELAPGEGLFEINVNEVVKEEEPTMGHDSVYSD